MEENGETRNRVPGDVMRNGVTRNRGTGTTEISTAGDGVATESGKLQSSKECEKRSFSLSLI